MHYEQQKLTQQQTHDKTMEQKQDHLKKIAQDAIDNQAKLLEQTRTLEQKHTAQLSLLIQQQTLQDQKLDQLFALVGSLFVPVAQEWDGHQNQEEF